MKLIIGNKNYSSWSFRVWLLLHSHGIEFSEVQESLCQDNIRSRLGKYSDSCKVPVLIDEELIIWDSLSICEYISESYLENHGWPTDPRDRAVARSICSEMHSGFNCLRSNLPMNCRLRTKLDLTEQVLLDIKRIEQIWSTYAVADKLGDLRLFGGFNIADCFFAPVALRFRTYCVQLDGLAGDYQSSLLEHPSVKEWVKLAVLEKEVVPENEIEIEI